MKKTVNWEENYSSFWLNDKEIFEYTKEDFLRRAEEFKKNGVTIAENFSVTHFRFGFFPYWEKLKKAFKLYVEAFHECGIEVYEHHSACLVHDLLRSEGWERFQGDIDSYTHFTSSVENWIEVPRFLVGEPEIYGKKLRTMLQIDGRTGKVADTVYKTNAFCFNNPDYRYAYFRYIKELLEEVPFDGMENDDVQWFGDGHACTCEHCRRLFKEEYGYDLPEPSGWDEFYNDYSNPVFIAWLRFKKDSTERFYRDLTKLYDSMGLHEIGRPNYQSDILKWNPTFSGFDSCLDQWDMIMQENCFSAIMRASYPEFMAEAIHRFSAGERNGVPSISYFYPENQDDTYFAWALSRTWGQLYSGTFEGKDITVIEKPYRDFEKKNILAYTEPKRLEDIAFYYSMQTRDFSAPQLVMAEKYSYPFIGALQASSFAKLGTNMAFEDDSVDKLLTHKNLLVAFMAMVNDDELKKFKEYANGGGKLIIYGDFATMDALGRTRDANYVLEALGIPAKAKVYEQTANLTVNYNGKSVTLTDMNSLLAFDGGEAVAVLDGKTVGIRASVGKGEIIWISAKPLKSEFQPTIWSNRRVQNPAPVEATPWLYDHQISHTGTLLRLLVGACQVEIECVQKELLLGAYNTPKGIAINICNVEGTIPRDETLIAHSDKLINFCEGAKRLPAMEISVKCEKIKRVYLQTPEYEGEVDLEFTRNDGEVKINVPADTFAAYALILLEE
ncbi:MAG: hypothetical protein IKU84_02360 [Clostridia bacterium]|nr:hypothetical protein [Clostridia bacterium]